MFCSNCNLTTFKPAAKTCIDTFLILSCVALLVGLALIALKTYYNGGITRFFSDLSQLPSLAPLSFTIGMTGVVVSTISTGVLAYYMLKGSKRTTALAYTLIAIALISAFALLLMNVHLSSGCKKIFAKIHYIISNDVVRAAFSNSAAAVLICTTYALILGSLFTSFLVFLCSDHQFPTD